MGAVPSTSRGSSITCQSLSSWAETVKPFLPTGQATEGRKPTRRRRDRLSTPCVFRTNAGTTDADATSPEEPHHSDRGEEHHSDSTATASEDPEGVQIRDDIESHEVFSEFPPAEILQGERLGRFGTAQLQDPVLSQAWGNAQVIEGQPQVGVSRLTYPHFMIKNRLLYRVDQRRGETINQLLVPKPYTTKVLYLAHTHLLGGHLGTEDL